MIPTGFNSTLTTQQKTELGNLKKILSEEKLAVGVGELDDDFLLRALRATMKDKNSKRLFLSSEAQKRVIKILEFKSKYNLLNIDADDEKNMSKPENIKEYARVYPNLCAFDDKCKRIVRMSRIGEFATNAKKNHFQTEVWEHCCGYEMSKCERQLTEFALRHGIENQGYISIACAKDLGLFGLMKNLGTTMLLSKIASEYFPETLDKVFIVNAPSVFERAYAIVRKFLDPVTAEKIQVFSNVPDFFAEFFDTKTLPEELGGKNPLTIPHCYHSPNYQDSTSSS